MSPKLVLQFLGSPQIYLDDHPVAADRRKAISLLAYLAVNDIGRPHQKYSREALSALLWPDFDQGKAFSSLRTTIWELRQAIGERWLLADRESVYLNEKADPSTRPTGQSGRTIDAVKMLRFGEGDYMTVKTENSPVRFMLMAGAPFKEPIVPYGPFVMNTLEEIQQTLQELRNGTFIKA